MTCSLLTAVGASIVAVVAAGSGHGTYLPAKCLFPYTMLSTRWTASITTPFIVVALLQFPVYGIILTKANTKQKVAWALCVVAAIHLLGVTFALMSNGSGFAP
jgi:hypothetical protein